VNTGLAVDVNKDMVQDLLSLPLRKSSRKRRGSARSTADGKALLACDCFLEHHRDNRDDVLAVPDHEGAHILTITGVIREGVGPPSPRVPAPSVGRCLIRNVNGSVIGLAGVMLRGTDSDAKPGPTRAGRHDGNRRYDNPRRSTPRED
jgi:hypothetical protein